MDVDEKPANVNIVESSQKISDDEIPPETINEVLILFTFFYTILYYKTSAS